MASVSVYNMEGKEVEKIDLNDSVFAAPVNEHLVHMAVVLQLANKRQGTQKAKTRSRRRQKALETEGNSTCETGFHPRSAVDWRRRCICAGSERLFI